MEFIFDLIFELLLEGIIEVSSNKNISKWIRYPLSIILILFFSFLIFLLIYLGVLLMKENWLCSLFFITVGIIMLIGCLTKFKEIYNKIKKKN